MSTVVISKNLTRDRNLVDTTKLERFTLDSKTLRRNENKEKKERRKLKKQPKHSSKLVTRKTVSDDSDQLEKSGLTEELEEPHNNIGYLSDGSQTSKKRKRENSLPPVVVESSVKAVHVGGNPLRIRLIFKKPKVDDSPSLPLKDHTVCSTSGAETLVRKESVVLSSVPCVKVSVPVENVLSASVAAVAKKIKKHKPSREDRYNALFDDWTPLSSTSVLANEVDSCSNEDADDWLFGNKRQEKRRESVGIDEDTNMCLDRTSDSSWPRARFLSEVGIYSLPYTVPF